MQLWIAKATMIAANAAIIVIRAPHGRRSRTTPVARKRTGPRETVLLTIAWLAFLAPLLWISTPLLDFANYEFEPFAYGAGVVVLLLGLWLFHRSHVDLGTNWSVTLEVRQEHRLITSGVYRWVRHPMYLALLIFSLGQALALPNWIAGPIYGVSMLILFALRVGPEERMMIEEFGDDYRKYQMTTKRLIPGIW
jgi:protein-S-isoprenylcysteine O-methyltransferase Ste14